MGGLFCRNRVSPSAIGSNADIQAGMCNADPITTEGRRIQMVQVGILILPNKDKRN